MSKYTTEVRFICESLYGLKEHVGQSKVSEILTDVAPKIFDFDFPIFDENYRTALEIKILRHRQVQLKLAGALILQVIKFIFQLLDVVHQFLEAGRLAEHHVLHYFVVLTQGFKSFDRRTEP